MSKFGNYKIDRLENEWWDIPVLILQQVLEATGLVLVGRIVRAVIRYLKSFYFHNNN